MMNFGIKKCATMVIRPDTPLFRNKRDLSYGFYWLLKARSGYRLDAGIAKAAKIIDQICPNFLSLL